MGDRARGLTLGLGLVLLIGAAALFLLRYRVFAVPTPSMSPAVVPGDRIVVDTWSVSVVRGDIVLADPAAVPGESGAYLVKRVDAVAGGRMVLVGDNRAVSVDSRTAGPVPTDLVRGRVVALAYPFDRSAFLPDRATPALRATTWSTAAGLTLILLAAVLSLRRRTRGTR